MAETSVDRDQLLEQASTPIEPVALTLSYRVALSAVALVMVLLPLAYLAIIGAVGFGIYYQIAHMGQMFEDSTRTYVGLLVVAVLLLVFLVRPLFSRLPEPPQPLSLRPGEEPFLHDFVYAVCDAVGAPRPRRIDIDSQVNASASLRQGFRSLGSRDLVLTIGSPLVAALSLQQLASILAHEFGHFSQNAGMKLSYIVRSVSAWFHRVVYERDQFDLDLERHAKNSSTIFGMIVLYAARAAIWLSRRVLWCLMRIGQLVSCSLMRQMEFDADRYAFRFAGSEAVSGSLTELPFVSVAANGAYSDLGSLWERRRLPADLPGLIAHHRKTLPEEVVQWIEQSTGEDTSGWLSTHPATSQRIEAAKHANADGVFASELPATVLFEDFDKTSRLASVHFYRQVLGGEFDPRDLISLDEIDAHREREGALARVLETFFQGNAFVYLPPTIERITAVPSDAEAELQTLRKRVFDERRELDRLQIAWSEQINRLGGARTARSLIECGFRLEPSDFHLLRSEASDARRVMDEAAAEMARLEDEIRPLTESLERRLSIALARAPAEPRDALLRASNALAAQSDSLVRLGEFQSILGNLATHRQEDDKKYDAELERVTNEAQSAIAAYRDQLLDVPNPLAGEHRQSRIGTTVLRAEPSIDLGELLSALQDATATARQLQMSLLGELGALAEEAESEIGFTPLPAPDRSGDGAR